eukprot:2126942-Pyramimonas_sp.AAC.1
MPLFLFSWICERAFGTMCRDAGSFQGCEKEGYNGGKSNAMKLAERIEAQARSPWSGQCPF